MGLDHVRSEIEHMRVQLGRQRKEILQLQRAGISTASAGLLLTRMLAKIDDLCAERDRLKQSRAVLRKGACLARGAGDARTIEMVRRAGSSPWLDALAELRQRAAREGHCFQDVQAIAVAIDQYAEKALGNRDYFLNKPYEVGKGRWPAITSA
jgi:hypothetical protein